MVAKESGKNMEENLFGKISEKTITGITSGKAFDAVVAALQTVNEIDNKLLERHAGYHVESFSIDLGLSPTLSIDFKKVEDTSTPNKPIQQSQSPASPQSIPATPFMQQQTQMPPVQQSHQCPRCGSQLRFISEHNQWYCDLCRNYL